MSAPRITLNMSDRVVRLGTVSKKRVTQYLTQGHNSSLWEELVLLMRNFYPNSSLYTVEISTAEGIDHMVEYYQP